MRTSALAVALVGVVSVLPACFGERLTKAPVPETGVSLRYDLEPGMRCHGHVRVGTVRELAGAGTLDQSIEFDIDVLAVGSDPKRGGTIVKARVSEVKLEWARPSVSPLVAERFERSATVHLESLELEFVASERGAMVEVPSVPAGADEELAAVVQTAIEAIEKTFVPLPEQRVRIGESWTETQTRGKQDQPGGVRESEIQATFEGLFRAPEDPRELAKLVIDIDRRELVSTPDGIRRDEIDEKSVVLFATEGFPARLDAEQQRFDPNAGVVFTKTRADWESPYRIKSGAELPQRIVTDPCDPEYVGPNVCED